jgi:hypothetical protein
MTQKMVDGALVDLTPEEQAEYDARQATPVVHSSPALDMGPSIAEQLGVTRDVKP